MDCAYIQRVAHDCPLVHITGTLPRRRMRYMSAVGLAAGVRGCVMSHNIGYVALAYFPSRAVLRRRLRLMCCSFATVLCVEVGGVVIAGLPTPRVWYQPMNTRSRKLRSQQDRARLKEAGIQPPLSKGEAKR